MAFRKHTIYSESLCLGLPKTILGSRIGPVTWQIEGGAPSPPPSALKSGQGSEILHRGATKAVPLAQPGSCQYRAGTGRGGGRGGGTLRGRSAVARRLICLWSRYQSPGKARNGTERMSVATMVMHPPGGNTRWRALVSGPVDIGTYWDRAATHCAGINHPRVLYVL